MNAKPMMFAWPEPDKQMQKLWRKYVRIKKRRELRERLRMENWPWPLQVPMMAFLVILLGVVLFVTAVVAVAKDAKSVRDLVQDLLDL